MNRKETKKKLIEIGISPCFLDDNMYWDMSNELLLGIDLSGADLTAVKLQGSNLQDTNLQGVIFKNADLRRAHLSWANLLDADFEGATLVEVEITTYQLAQAKNLEHAYLDPGRYADAVAYGYKPEKKE
ncbi:MAG: pentapeptide repeat-containing protein [bacterium]|nr:pentapeptide repeat-containing protein [bacterium]